MSNDKEMNMDAKMTKQDLDAIFSSPRNDGPGRKGTLLAPPKDVDCGDGKNLAGCTGIRNPPKEIEQKMPSVQVYAKAIKLWKMERRKLTNIKKALGSKFNARKK